MKTFLLIFGIICLICFAAYNYYIYCTLKKNSNIPLRIPPSINHSNYLLKAKGEEAVNFSLLDVGLDDESSIINRLVDCFEKDKPYLSNTLKISDVARMIYTNNSYLSRVLNQKMSSNFNQFVNSYRIKHVCEYFIQHPDDNIWIICNKSGFKNQSSFTTAFKMQVGYTPASWCKEVRARIAHKERVKLKDYLN